MHDLRHRVEVRARARRGQSVSEIARELGLPLSTVCRWIARRTPTDNAPPPRCSVCGEGQLPASAYAYVLGQYLGDGHLVTNARTPVLRVYASADYPALTSEIITSITTVRGTKPAVMRMANSDRCFKIQSYWMHWPCLLPQHGPGRKHERPIRLVEWQQKIVNEHPWPLIRGLIHSDGCRGINRVVVRGVAYEYPRYFFSNESRDILAIMGDALDRVGVAWRFNRPNSISIARRAAVAAMDAHLGPKS